MTKTTAPALDGDRIRRRIEASPVLLIEAVAVLYLEVETGCRPATHLEAIVSPSVYGRVSARTRSTERRRRPGPARGAVRTVHVCRPGPDAIEATVVVTVAGRTRALAMRVERHVGRWRVVELAAPEDGDAPRRTASLQQRTPQPDAFKAVLGEDLGRLAATPAGGGGRQAP